MSIPLLFIMSITSPSLPLIDPTLTLPMVNLHSSSAVANFSPPTSFASDGAPLFRDPRICGTRGRVVCSILLCIHGVLALFTTVYVYRIYFVDFEKAFDRVDWIKMMEALECVGVDWRDRRLIYTNYT